MDSKRKLRYASPIPRKSKPVLMKSTIDHLPPVEQHKLHQVVELLREEFDDVLKGASAEFTKRGRILKIILFGSYARGGWVDDPHTKKGYRSVL
ncbi:hypothetical protein [Rhizobium sp. P38BS-XIX]|uniref:hypothetical protein n=1 Tax=Rhizobium sp. P38BS-XIX TaxID=2726740 RepID=UPI0032B20922